ncbi:MAG: vanadium-dependent haloperoxidase [Cyclobacteriaceae bacterium]|nr:vanadium-dependent haloperoxidase [Cyclobacteriaceae bacterium]MDH4296694.1 vanadium-dependent haloperoxidase [Cyclobacteriaceae bacterium]MDH5250602.1 vanadium-dependent haloperoxidase [Cyclobacteriaceae bacterium]
MSKACQYILLTVLLLTQSCSNSGKGTDEKGIGEPTGENNLAYRWGKISLACTANDTENFKPRPTITSRILALTWVSIFDAWSRYDDHAIPMYLTSVERRPREERTLKNKEIAISYAAYRAMLEYYYSDSTLLRKEMINMGLDPNDNSMDPSSPIGIGNLAARTVIAARLDDGANQRGKEANSDGTPYSDYTGYSPVNNADNLNDLSRWQPKYFSDGKGGKYAPGCLTPHWWKIKPLALDSPNQFRPGPPPAIGSKQLADEVKEVIDLQANLTNEQKALVEFMRDGPKSVQQAGHWFVFAQDVSVRDHHTLDEDVKMYFLVEMAAMDAFIASWDAKMFYDYARPYALVHDYYQSQVIKAWGGPEKGMVQVKGTEWRPYSPETFLCPPFPSYVSGHSTVSGACAETLRRFTNNDEFGAAVKLVPGILTEPKHIGDTVVINFPTFTETANMAGMSRVLGGYHIQADNVEGLKLGRNVAGAAWRKYLEHVGE